MIEGEDVADGRVGRGGFGEGEGRGRGEGESFGEGGDEFFGGGGLEGAGGGVGGEEGEVLPDGDAVGATLHQERPAREGLAGVVFAGGLDDDGAGAGDADEGVGELAGVGELGGAEGGGLPLGADGIGGDEGGFAAHGEGDAAALERGFDGDAAGADVFPDGGVVGGVGHRRSGGWRSGE